MQFTEPQSKKTSKPQGWWIWNKLQWNKKASAQQGDTVIKITNKYNLHDWCFLKHLYDNYMNHDVSEKRGQGYQHFSRESEKKERIGGFTPWYYILKFIIMP